MNQLQTVTIPEAVTNKIEKYKVLMYDGVMEYFLYWKGGHEVIVVNKKGMNIIVTSVGDRRLAEAPQAQVEQWMKDRISNCDYIYF